MITRSCKTCKRTFKVKPSCIKRGNGLFCSRSCHFEYSRKGKMVPCGVCGKETYKQRKALKKSKSGKFFCGKSCQTKWRNQQYIQEEHPNWKDGTHSYRGVMHRGGVLPVCRLCELSDERVLAVHHLDKNRKNNNLDNLVWLCHNCHHLVHTREGEQEKLMALIV